METDWYVYFCLLTALALGMLIVFSTFVNMILCLVIIIISGFWIELISNKFKKKTWEEEFKVR